MYPTVDVELVDLLESAGEAGADSEAPSIVTAVCDPAASSRLL